MSESNQQSEGREPASSERGGKLSRRELIRAGLKAAPLVATLKPDLVMATLTTGNTIRPSAFSSFVNNGGRCSVKPGGSASDIGKCLTISECVSRCSTSSTDTRFKSRYHNAYGVSVHCGFLYSTSNKLCNGTKINPLLREIIGTTTTVWTSKRDKLARYCAMAYMSGMHYGSSSFLSMVDCLAIWNACQGGGSWNCGGVPRSLDWVLNYFDCVYNKPSNFDACLSV